MCGRFAFYSPSEATAALFNARAETVAEKPSFRAAFRRRLVLADGFYEWKKEGSTKTPYLISLANSAPFAFAGLWENWSSKEGDVSIQSATKAVSSSNRPPAR